MTEQPEDRWQEIRGIHKQYKFFYQVGGGITLYLAVTRPDVLIRKDCIKDGVTMVCGEEARRILEAAGRDEDRPAP